MWKQRRRRPYRADLDEDTSQRTLRFYLDQWRDYVGSPMLALYGVWAAWTGDRELSLDLQEEGFAAYQSNASFRRWNTGWTRSMALWPVPFLRT